MTQHLDNYRGIGAGGSGWQIWVGVKAWLLIGNRWMLRLQDYSGCPGMH